MNMKPKMRAMTTYNTGKVEIGVRYQMPMPSVTTEMLVIQASLLPKPKARVWIHSQHKWLAWALSYAGLGLAFLYVLK